MDRSASICKSVLDVIGNTPIIELSRLTKVLDGKILAKMDYLNPGFSKKDRIALQMIQEAEHSGALKPNQTVVELTSGNTGTGLAIVCGIKGYPFIAVMSKGNTNERARMMRALGAEVILVEQAPGSTPGTVSGESLELVEQETNRIVEEYGAFRCDQFNLNGNFNAWYLRAAREIIQQTKGNFDGFCDFMGTGGTFAGLCRAFKEFNPKIQCYVIEPINAAVVAGNKVLSSGDHKIQGGGYAMSNLMFLKNLSIDGALQVTDEEAYAITRRLAKEEGIFAGPSSGANVHGALQLLKGPLKGKTVFVVLPDSGLKYLSTDLW
ncbi:MAG: cysteine synthase family protein [Candidatus Heimdallarchaeota archaeon]|nr:MAG: cysteine synthase family protein [Candidatus Heimdallarchaeota archaeon]